MKQFLVRVLLFSIPVIMVMLLPIAILKKTGENYTGIDGLIERNEKYLIGYVYNEGNYGYLKWKAVTAKPKQQVLAMGTSRVLGFRAAMFKTSFYNAGYTVLRISDFLPFLKTIPKEKYPDVLVINLDQWMFNKQWVTAQKPKADPDFKKFAPVSTLTKVYSDLFDKKYGLDILQNSADSDRIVRVGLQAVVNNKGFKNDGHMFYGQQITKLLKNDPSAFDYNFSDTRARINEGNRRFEFGDSIYTNVLGELDTLLRYCKQNNVRVVAFLPPFATQVQQWLNDGGKHEYMRQIFPVAAERFKQYGFELWDLSSLSTFGSDDSENLDGFHSSEVGYAKMLIHMVRNGSLIAQYVDTAKLNNDIQQKVNRYTLYAY